MQVIGVEFVLSEKVICLKSRTTPVTVLKYIFAKTTDVKLLGSGKY